MAKSITACGFPEEKVVSHPPKLIDMLVDAGLNKGFEWPDGFDYCVQDHDHMPYLVFGEGVMTYHKCWTTKQYCNVDSCTLIELADDYQTSQISKQEYMEALEKAKKELISEAELDEPKETKLNSIVKVDVVLEPRASIPDTGIWYLSDMLTEYSRKKEAFSLLEKELDGTRKELHELQENIRILCKQQGWKIEPV